jgi:tape measure domain-containing protein
MTTVLEEFVVKLGVDADDKGVSKLGNSLGGINRLVFSIGAAIGSAFAVSKIIAASDQMSNLNARFESLLGSQEAAADISDKLYQSAQRLGGAYGDVADAAARVLPALQEQGRSADDAIKLAEIQLITAQLSGASTQEAASSAMQFAQALGSGVLQGEELRSILEGNNTLARYIADGFGVSVTQLRKMGAAGQLTSADLTKHMLAAYERIAKEGENLPLTFGRIGNRARNLFLLAVGKLNESGTFDGLKTQLNNLVLFFEKNLDTIIMHINALIYSISFVAGVVYGVGVIIGRTFNQAGEAIGKFVYDSKAVLMPLIMLLAVFFVPYLIGLAVTTASTLAAIIRMKWAWYVHFSRINAAATASALWMRVKMIGTFLTMAAAAWRTGLRMAAAWLVGLGPIGWVVLAIAAVGTALTVLWKKSETFRNIVIAVWTAIKNGAIKAWDEVAKFFTGKVDAIIGAWGKVKSLFSGLLGDADKLANKDIQIDGRSAKGNAATNNTNSNATNNNVTQTFTVQSAAEAARIARSVAPKGMYNNMVPG